MNTKQKQFFSKPRTMQEVTEMFNGDIYAANTFQSINLIGRELKTIDIAGKLHFVNYSYTTKTKVK